MLTHCVAEVEGELRQERGEVKLVIRYLERAVRDGKDIEARGNMQVAASMGAIAFQKDLGATHSLAHPLSTEFGLNHGLANSLCLPAVMRFTARCHRALCAPRGLFGDGSGTPAEAADRSVTQVEAMIARLGITAGLRNHKVPRESLAGAFRAGLCGFLPPHQHSRLHPAGPSRTLRTELVAHEHNIILERDQPGDGSRLLHRAADHR